MIFISEFPPLGNLVYNKYKHCIKIEWMSDKYLAPPSYYYSVFSIFSQLFSFIPNRSDSFYKNK